MARPLESGPTTPSSCLPLFGWLGTAFWIVVLVSCGETESSKSTLDPAGSGGSAGARDPDAAAFTEVCERFASSLCAKRDACLPGDVGDVFATEGLCAERFQTECTKTLSAESSGATPDDVEVCAAANEAAACLEFAAPGTLAACNEVFGSLDDGADCAFSAQCQSGFCAVGEDACGKCRPRLALGDTCRVTIECSFAGLYCNSQSRTCEQYVAEGEDCLGKVCAPGSSCRGPSAEEKSCVANVEEEGEACDRNLGPDCEGLLGLYCQTDTCAPPFLGEAGALCGFVRDAGESGEFWDCEPGLVCFSGNAATPEICHEPAADGAACDRVDGPPCLPPARCTVSEGVSTCKLPDPAACGG
jgi:hypothetical protein